MAIQCLLIPAPPNSIVFRLIGQPKFVVRRRNSIDPLSNEFVAQATEIFGDKSGRRSRLAREERDFR
jgi:hypothetical protein